MTSRRAVSVALVALAACLASTPFACGGLVSDDASSSDASTDSRDDGTIATDAGDLVDRVATEDAPRLADARPDHNPCSATSCPSGCCDTNGTCRAGTDNGACGFGAQQCVACAQQGLSCVASDGGANGGTCAAPDAGTACGPTNCTGCCAQGICLDGANSNQCGSHGQSCAACGASQTCGAVSGGGGQCRGSAGTCNPLNCTGCCDANGRCIDTNENAECGSNGAACQSCAPGQACLNGSCQTLAGCGPLNCPGCCNGAACMSGADNGQCGAAGQACTRCTNGACAPYGPKAGGRCTNGVACGFGNCPTGCCGFDLTCFAGNTGTNCGSDGGACGTCSGTCVDGRCQGTSCSAATCSGCCLPDGTCWMGAKDSAHCGYDGQLCFDCGGGYTCGDPGLCIPQCGPQNCQGCCQGGACVTGNDVGACGTGGAACAACGPNQQCTASHCQQPFVCNASTCAGCCTTNGFCALGTHAAQCGKGGAACADCSARSVACNAGVCGP